MTSQDDQLIQTRFDEARTALEALRQNEVDAVIGKGQVMMVRLREVERELEESRRQVMELYDSAPVGYATLDGAGQIQDANLTLAKMLGAERELLVGESLRNYIHEEDRRTLPLHLDRCRNMPPDASPDAVELRLAGPNGKWRTIQLISQRCPNVQNEDSETFRTAFFDVTELPRMLGPSGPNYTLLNSILQEAREPIFAKDLQGRYVLINPAGAAVIGKPPGEIVGKTDSEIFPHEVAARIMEVDKRVLETGRSGTQEETTIVDGVERLFLTDKWAYRDEKGQILGLVGTATDITERKRMEEELAFQHGLMNEVLQGIEEMTFAIDRNHRYLMFNPAYARFLGKKPKEIIGKHVNEMWPPDIAAELTEQNNRILSTGEPETKKDERFYNGVLKAVSISKGPIRDQEGNITGLYGFVRDITEQEEEKKKQQERLDNLRSVLSGMQIGAALVDEDGCIRFISQVGLRLFKKKADALIGKKWTALHPFARREITQLESMFTLSPKFRRRIVCRLAWGKKRDAWVEIDVQDHPSRPEQKIFCFYDATEIQEFRSQIYDQEKFEGMVGKSKAMADVFELIRSYAEVAATIMIEGETGTGKEMVARAIYALSPRKEGPFITVNCAALTDTLLEGQLFGHKKGSFTGALQDQKGVFEAADQGTIFLDEIGDLSTAAQTRLLRVLQEHEVTRVGETRPRKIDVRVITATNKDLDEEVAKGNFRLDLLYRIKVGRIYLPPLRERREDIPLLANFFLHQSEAASSKQIEGFTDEAMDVLTQYDWPGNLRELQNAVEFAIIYAREKEISREDFPPEMQVERNQGEASSSNGDLKQPSCNEEEERERILSALDQTKGNRTKAARVLGIGRTTLYRQMKNLGLMD